MIDKKNNWTPAVAAAAMSGDLDNFIAASTPGGIEKQEAAGQSALIENCLLPIEISPSFDGTEITWADIVEKFGFKKIADHDDILFKAELPPAWKLTPNANSSFWSTIFDDQGRDRAGVFYKAAFYDRKAHLYLDCRYRVTRLATDEAGNETDYDSATHRKFVVCDVKKVIHEVGIRSLDVFQPDYHKASTDWLDEFYPLWRDPFAYWE